MDQLIRNPLFEEAEAEFQQVAFFKTSINLRKSFQDELTPNETGGVDPAADREFVLITLTRPLIYLQPVAVDKASPAAGSKTPLPWSTNWTSWVG